MGVGIAPFDVGVFGAGSIAAVQVELIRAHFAVVGARINLTIEDIASNTNIEQSIHIGLVSTLAANESKVSDGGSLVAGAVGDLRKTLLLITRQYEARVTSITEVIH